MNKINYIKGDASKPIGNNTKIICHCCNDEGGWGSGFVNALSKKWKRPETFYREWFTKGTTNILNPLEISAENYVIVNEEQQSEFKLGSVQAVQVEKDIWVINIIGQHKTISSGEVKPIRYKALESGFNKVVNMLDFNKNSIHMPRIGAGLARGNWEIIEQIINKTLINNNFDVTVYDLI